MSRSVYLSSLKFFVIKSTNIEDLREPTLSFSPWAVIVLSSQDSSKNKADKKKKKKAGRKKETKPKLFILEFQNQILDANIFEGFLCSSRLVQIAYFCRGKRGFYDMKLRSLQSSGNTHYRLYFNSLLQTEMPK